MILNPRISVVIPVYNAGKFLRLALGSIVEQSFTDWEMICVNDGSTDDSQRVLEWFANQDNRIQVIEQSNGGIVSALNRACEMARGKYLLRMDADDISLPDRMVHQLEFMDSHPEVVACGGAILSMDADGEPLEHLCNAIQHETIVERLLHRQTGLFHPASILQTSAFRECGGYRAPYQWIEDHDLWLRLSRIGKLANTDHVVLCYRQHAASVCWQRAQRQRELMNELLREAHSERGLQFDEEAIANKHQRSAVNPGKWARMAAKGGFPRTAWKHLKRLGREQGLSLYTARMFAEVAARLAKQACIPNRHQPCVQIPKLARWQSS